MWSAPSLLLSFCVLARAADALALAFVLESENVGHFCDNIAIPLMVSLWLVSLSVLSLRLLDFPFAVSASDVSLGFCILCPSAVVRSRRLLLSWVCFRLFCPSHQLGIGWYILCPSTLRIHALFG